MSDSGRPGGLHRPGPERRFPKCESGCPCDDCPMRRAQERQRRPSRAWAPTP